MSWQYKNTVLIYTSEKFEYKPSVAGCGLMHTVVKVDTETEEWGLVDMAYMDKFKAIHDSGGSIIFMSNQKKALHINTIKARFNRFMKTFVHVEKKSDATAHLGLAPIATAHLGLAPIATAHLGLAPIATAHLGLAPIATEVKCVEVKEVVEPSQTPIPIMALFATKRNCFMKPFTNLWKVAGFMYHFNKHPPPDVASSIYIGRCDGSIYLKNWKEVGVNKFAHKLFQPMSDVDRAFANNIEVQFVGRTQFFYDKPEPKWKWSFMLMEPDARIKYIKQHKDDVEPNIKELIPDPSKHLIIVMGRPSSGRTMLINRIIDELDEGKESEGEPPHVIHVKSSQKKYSKKLLTSIRNAIYERTTIIKIDFSDYKHRNDIIKIAREFETPTLIINLTTNRKICTVLNYTKVQTSTDFTLEVYGPPDYTEWEKHYEEPEYDDADIKVIEYPMVLRFRKELKYRYSPF